MTDWTVDELFRLEQLWNADWSGSEIAAVLPGRSRNAVIGAVHRYGMATRNGAQRKPKPTESRVRPPRKPTQRRKEVPVSPSPVVLLRPPEPPRSACVRLVDHIEGQCRYPVSDDAGADMLYCGLPTRPGTSWCAYHDRVCCPRAYLEAAG